MEKCLETIFFFKTEFLVDSRKSSKIFVILTKNIFEKCFEVNKISR